MGLFRKNGLARFLKNSIFVQGEAFDARLEFKKIILLPKKERQKTLDEFRKKYLRQKIGIALLQVRVLDLIRRDPDLSTEELCSEAKELGNNYGLNSNHLEQIAEIIASYGEARKAIMDFRDQYPNDRDLYRVLFGRDPIGRVKVFCGPIILHFHCNNLEDYTRIFFNLFYSVQEVTEDQKRIADLSVGVFLRNAPFESLIGTITAEKLSWLKRLERMIPGWLSISVYDHEEQHAIYSLLSDVFLDGWEYEQRELCLAKELRSLRTQLKEVQSEQARLVLSVLYYLQVATKNALEDARDEILASLIGGRNPGGIFEKLIVVDVDGEYYDFFYRSYSKLEKEISSYPEASKNFIIQAMRDTRMKYINILWRSLGAVKKIKKMGFSTKELVALLTWEPVIRWPRLAQQIKNLIE